MGRIHEEGDRDEGHGDRYWQQGGHEHARQQQRFLNYSGRDQPDQLTQFEDEVTHNDDLSFSYSTN